MAPSNAEGLAAACAVNEPLEEKRFGEPLDQINNDNLRDRQTHHIAARYGLPVERARLVATFAFGNGGNQ